MTGIVVAVAVCIKVWGEEAAHRVQSARATTAYVSIPFSSGFLLLFFSFPMAAHRLPSTLRGIISLLLLLA